jgi:purine-binding chemotaxis protein CheW
VIIYLGILKMFDQTGSTLMSSTFMNSTDSDDNHQIQEDLKLISLVNFKIADQTFGIEIIKIREIINLCPICEVPYTPDFILGVINLRGCINAVLDIRKFFKIPACTDYGRDSRIIVMNINEKSIGVIVDKILGVVSVSEKSIRKTPISMDQEQSKFISGIAQLENEIVIIVNMKEIVNCREMLAFRSRGE